MGKRRLIPLSIGCVVAALFIAVSLTESAQATAIATNRMAEGHLYNPYPAWHSPRPI